MHESPLMQALCSAPAASSTAAALTLPDDALLWLLTVVASDPYYARDMLGGSGTDTRQGLITLVEGFMSVYDNVEYVAGNPDCERMRKEVQELEELMLVIPALPGTYAQDVANATLEVALDLAAKVYRTP